MPQTKLAKLQNTIICDGKYIVRKADAFDAVSLRADVREVDRMEWDYTIAGGLDHLEGCIHYSEEAWTVADEEDRALIICGVVDHHGTTPGEYPDPPSVWLIGTNASDRAAIELQQGTRALFNAFFTRWQVTQCLTWSGNHKHHRWLEWWGYRLIGAMEYGPSRETFYSYVRGV